MVMSHLRVLMLCRRGAAAVISTGFRCEGRYHRPDAGAQPEQHIHNDRVVTNQNAMWLELRWNVSVAYVPREPHEGRCIRSRNFLQLLRRGFYAHYSSIFEPQPVSRAQHRCTWQVQEKSRPATRDVTKPTPVPLVEGQYDAVDRRGAEPFSRRQNFDSTNERGHDDSEEKISLGHR